VQPYRYLEHDWFHYSARFPYAGAAKQAWEQLDAQLAGKGLDLGVYRHGPSTNPGKTVTAVSLSPKGVMRARQILRRAGGQEIDILDDGQMGKRELEAMIMRRVRKVVGELHQAEAEERPLRSHEVIRHGGGGSRLHPDGTMEE
jgi:hypothetical protein